MKKVKLFLFNYGTITQIADFKNAGHDANICLRSLNDNQIKGHGYLPKTIFYYLTWQAPKSGNIHVTVDYSGNTARDTSHEQIIKSHLFKNNILTAV